MSRGRAERTEAVPWYAEGIEVPVVVAPVLWPGVLERGAAPVEIYERVVGAVDAAGGAGLRAVIIHIQIREIALEARGARLRVSADV